MDLVRSRSFAVALFTLVFAVLVVPYWLPPPRDVVGASAEVGYNNSFAYVAYVLLLLPTAVLLARALRPLSRAQRPTSDRSRGSWYFLGCVLALNAMFFAVVYHYRGSLSFAEGLYFQSLLHRMSLGETPLVDFAFFYGPSMIYPAHWIGSVVGLELGYAMWFILTHLVGIALLFWILEVLTGSRWSAAKWATLLALALFSPWAGLNVNLLRFTLPAAALLLAARAIAGSARSWIALVPVLVFALLYTFDVALLTMAGLLLLVLLEADPIRRLVLLTVRVAGGDAAARLPPVSDAPRRAAVIAGALGAASAACVAVLLAMDPGGVALRAYPGAALSYSSGAYNQPIFLSLPFWAVTLVTLAAIALVLRVPLEGPLPTATMAFAGISVLAQKATFTVPDPSHFAYYSIPVLILFAAYATRLSSGLLAGTLAGAIVVGLALPLQYYHATQFLPGLIRASVTVSEPAAPTRASVEASLDTAVKIGGEAPPYLMYGLEYYSLPIYRKHRLRYPSYETHPSLATTSEAVDRVIEEVRRTRPMIILLQKDLTTTRSYPADPVADFLARALNTQLRGSDVRGWHEESASRLHEPFFKFVRSEYRVIAEIGQIVLLAPRS